MFESFGFETLTAPQAAIGLALLVGLSFGALAEQTRFCFRRSLIGEDRVAAMGVWLMALAVAVVGTQAAVAGGLISFSQHRFMTPDLPLLALLAGGALFGAGMVLTRGCVARLTVLGASGNLRALTVLILFAVIAHAAQKGVLAPLRTALTAQTVDLGAYVSLAALPGGATTAALVIALIACVFALRSGNRARHLIMAALLGALVPLAWVGTGFVLYDDFDPIALQSLSFTAPWSDLLFWTIASSAIPAGFGTGLIIGVLSGALLSALAARRFEWVSFSTPRETGRYLSGAALMGIGGVLAGGCTVGAGLAGVPTLSVAALITLLSIAGGALATNALLKRTNSGMNAGTNAGTNAGSPLHPAE